MLSSLEYHTWIERESDTFASVLDTAPLDARVPGCPEWALRDLAGHLGRVQRLWTDVIRAGVDVLPTFPTSMSGPADAGELAAWMRDSTRNLLDAIRTTPFDTPAWAWWRDDHTVGAIARHQVQEVAVHRWDAQSAVGTPDPIAMEIADDGVDEFLWIARQMRGPAPVTFVATDSGRSFSASEGASAVTVSAAASDLVLLLYGRVPPDDVLVEGDRATLHDALMPIG